jgi:Na+/proline symporter
MAISSAYSDGYTLLKNFPYISLLVMAGLAFVFSLLFRMGEVITAIITMRIIVQFVGRGGTAAVSSQDEK